MTLLLLVGAVSAACANPGLLQVVPPPSAEHEDLKVTVPRMLLTLGLVHGAGGEGDRMLVEAEILNEGVTDLPLDPQQVRLLLSPPDRVEQARSLPLTAWGVGPLPRAVRRQTDRPAVILRNGEKNRVWFELGGLDDVDELPSRLAMQMDLGGQTVELILADPTRASPRWQLRPPAHKGGVYGVSAVLIEDRTGIAMSVGGTSRLGPLVLQLELQLVLLAEQERSGAGGVGAAGRLVWPIARPWSWLGRRQFLGPHLGGTAYGLRQFETPTGEDPRVRLYGAELGVSLLTDVGRVSAAPFPLVRPPSPMGDLGLRLGYVHWFGEGVGSAGAPGLMLSFTSSAY